MSSEEIDEDSFWLAGRGGSSEQTAWIAEEAGARKPGSACERCARAQRFLVELGDALWSSLDHDAVLAQAGRGVVGFLADLAVVDIVEDGGMRRLGAWAGPALAPVADLIASSGTALPGSEWTWTALETGRPEIEFRASPQTLRVLARDDEALHRVLANASILTLPLLAEVRPLGVLVLVSLREDRRYGPSELAISRRVAHEAALVARNARSFQDARRAIEARDEVLGAVAHDMRSPVGAILLTAAVLERRIAAGRTAEAEELLAKIVRYAGRSLRLVEDLLDVRKGETGRLSIERSRIRGETLVLEAVDAHALLAASASITLRAYVSEGSLEVWADQNRLLQVFDNLISNALRYAPAGGHVSVGMGSAVDGVVFWVADDGPGIPSSMLPGLFDRSWQGRGTHPGGLGLGLLLARRLVEVHGGKIWAESRSGAGTRISFTIPSGPCSRSVGDGDPPGEPCGAPPGQ